MKNTKKKPKNVKEFDKYFEDHDIADLLDQSTVVININFPSSMLRLLDKSAKKMGLSRPDLIKHWATEKLVANF